MTFFQVDEAVGNSLADEPEHFQNVHLVSLDGKLALVIDCQIVVLPDAKLEADFDGYFTQPWLKRDRIGWTQRVKLFQQWAGQHRAAPAFTVLNVDRKQAAHIAFSLGPLPRHATVPATLVTPYAHLPLIGSAGPGDIYYRHEAFPKSLRINQTGGTVAANTYFSPSSELRFLTTGLNVVGRCALPCYFPAVFRWRIEPATVQTIRCGACVPQFGQSGGGVEVLFPGAFSNNGPIPNPTILPIL